MGLSSSKTGPGIGGVAYLGLPHRLQGCHKSRCKGTKTCRSIIARETRKFTVSMSAMLLYRRYLRWLLLCAFARLELCCRKISRSGVAPRLNHRPWINPGRRTTVEETCSTFPVPTRDCCKMPSTVYSSLRVSIRYNFFSLISAAKFFEGECAKPSGCMPVMACGKVRLAAGN